MRAEMIKRLGITEVHYSQMMFALGQQYAIDNFDEITADRLCKSTVYWSWWKKQSEYVNEKLIAGNWTKDHKIPFQVYQLDKRFEKLILDLV